MKGIKKIIVLLVLFAMLCAALAVAACANLGGGTGTGTPGVETPGDDTDPDDPGTGDTDPDDPGTGDTDPDDPGTGDTDPDDPGTGDTDPDDPGTGDTDPEVPFDKESCTHPDATFVVTEEATCTAGGTLTYTCPDCEDTWTVQTEALGHDFVGEACEGQTCTRCEEKLPATASHLYAETANTATCTEEGKKTFTCQTCGDTYTEPSLALGHAVDPASWKDTDDREPVGSQCTYIVERVGHCDRCDKDVTESVIKIIHNYEYGVVSEATCTRPGTMGIRCSECDEVQDETKLVSYTAEHSWDAGTEQEGYILYTCQNDDCGATRQKYTESSATVSTEQLVNGEVSVGDVVLSIDKETAGGLGADVSVSAKEEDISGMFDDTVLDRVGDSTVYNLTLNNGAITNFDGSVTVKLPYTLADGEDPASITIWYITEEGELIAITNAVYNEGYVTFTTDHFSYYTVGKFDKAEMCEKFGHLIDIIDRQATCTQDGYHIEICLRCDKVLVNKTTPALGHEFTESGRVKATCTQDGSVTYTCSVCKESYTAVLKATGHNWVLDEEESTAATCEAEGKEVYACSACDATYTRTLPRLSHSYTKTVTAATCTSAGYTTYTCTRCGYSYKADYVSALGHTWNISAPTCGEGQVCTVCGAAGLPATGQHNMVDGVCTVCGQGCEHDFVKGAVTAPTCTEAGYTTYTCSKCGTSEKRDYTAALGHDFAADFTKCGRCGTANPQLEELYENMAESLAAGDFALTIEGLSMRGGNIYDNVMADNGIVGVEGVSAAFRYEDGKLLLSADGYLINEGAYGYEIKIPFVGYGDGTYLYARYEMDIGEQYLRVAYSELMPVLEGALGASGAAGQIPVESLLDILQEQLLPLAEKVLNSDGGLRYEFMNKLVTAAFSGGSTENGYEFTANVGKLRTLNEVLATKGIASAFDHLFGEGAFDSLVSFAEDVVFDNDIRAAADKLLGYAAEVDVTSDELFTLIDSVMIELSGDATFSIEAMLNDDQYANTTLATLLEQMNGMQEGEVRAMFDQYVEQFKSDEMSVYALITGGNEESVQMLKETVDAALGSDDKASVVLTMTTDASGAVTGFDLTLDVNVAMESGGHGFDYTIEGGIGIAVGGGAKVENASLASEFEGMWNQYLSTLRSAVSRNGGSYNIGEYNFTVEEGKLVMFGKVAQNGRSESGGPDWDTGLVTEYIYENVIEFTLPDLSACGVVILTPDCGTSYQVELAGAAKGMLKYVTETVVRDSNTGSIISSETTEEERGEGSGLYDLSTWYDPASGQFRQNYSAHDFVRDEDRSQTEEDVDCEQYYEEVYICENCGEERIIHSYKSHTYRQAAELLPGSETCEDGVRVFDECIKCGAENPYNENISYDHIMVEHSETFLISGEEVTVRYYACACRHQSSYSGVEGGCGFTGDVEKEDILEGGSYIGYRETYNCYETGCDGRMVVEHYDATIEGCLRTSKEVYSFYDGEQKVKEITFTNSEYEHYMSRVEEECVNTDSEYIYVARCENCGYEERSTERYDGYGRLTLRESSSGYEGRMHETRTEYTYSGGSCECEVVEYVNGEETGRYTSSRHSEERFCEVYYEGEPTCTQPIYTHYLCKACEEEVYSDTIVKGHSYEYDAELDMYVCADCGLQNAQGTDGEFIFEDLTDNAEHGREGYLALGYYNRGGWDYDVLFRFVPVGGESDAETGAGIVTYDIYYEETDSILYISLDEVAAAAENYVDEEGNPAPVDLTQYDLRVTFPSFGDATSLTFTGLAERLGLAA